MFLHEQFADSEGLNLRAKKRRKLPEVVISAYSLCARGGIAGGDPWFIRVAGRQQQLTRFANLVLGSFCYEEKTIFLQHDH